MKCALLLVVTVLIASVACAQDTFVEAAVDRALKTETINRCVKDKFVGISAPGVKSLSKAWYHQQYCLQTAVSLANLYVQQNPEWFTDQRCCDSDAQLLLSSPRYLKLPEHGLDGQGVLTLSHGDQVVCPSGYIFELEDIDATRRRVTCVHPQDVEKEGAK